MRPLPLLSLAFGLLAPLAASAAEIKLDGKWMMTEVQNRVVNDRSKLTFPAGTMTVEIHGGTMTVTDAMDPGEKPTILTKTITVKEATEAKTVIVVAGGGDPAETSTVTRDDSGLVFTDDKMIMHLVPYDEVAVAKAAAKRKDAEKPAAPLAEHPLSGRFGGADWTASFCRRSQITFPDDDGIRCEILAEKPADQFTPIKHLIVVLPNKPGTYPLGDERTLTFYTPPKSNLMALHGELVIEKVDGTTVTFGLSARADAENEVNGRMTVDLGPAPVP